MEHPSRARCSLRLLLIAVASAAAISTGCGTTAASPAQHTQVAPPTNGAAAFDAARRVVLLVPQSSQVDRVVQTWTWDGVLWTRQEPTISPSARSEEVLAYDVQRRVTVLYGGNDAKGGWLTDTWEWNGAKWTQIRTPHAPPQTQAGFATMAYDPAARLMMLFQWGRVSESEWMNQTWTWNGKDWTLMHPGHTPSLSGVTLVFDGHHLVLVGDTYDGNRSETWSWSGSDWSLVATAGFRGFANAPAVLDGRSSTVVAFGGGPGDDTWIWNGSVWSRAHPQHSPDGTPQPLLYDGTLKRVVGFAGVGNTGITGIYEWTGTDWTAIGTRSRPTVPAGKNVMQTGQAFAWIRQTVTGAQPVLLPKLPAGVDQAWCRADATGFDLKAENDDRSIQIDMAIVVPGNSNLGAANKNIPFRGTSAYYQFITSDPTGWRDLWWVELPGHWTGDSGLKGGQGVPYVLSSNGLSEGEFFAMARSLS